jgi:hypothetical protein
MKKLILLFFIFLLRQNVASSQIIYSANTYYVIPPTSGCDGVWAIEDPSLSCYGPFVYWYDPNTCWTFSHNDGDTLFLNLCSLPCNFAAAGLDSSQTGSCINVYTCQYNVCHIYAIGVDLSCTGTCDGMVSAEGMVGNSPYSIVWSNGSSAESISNLCPGTYTVTLTDATGCIVSDSVTISQPLPLQVVQSITNPTCQTCTNGIAVITVSGGSGNYSYQWCDGSNTTATYIGYGCCPFTVTDLTTGCVVTDSACAIYNLDMPEFLPSDLVQIYPNPAETSLHINVSDSDFSKQKFFEIRLYDISGRTILQQQFQSSIHTIDLRALSAGVYTIAVQIDQKTVFRKITKK